MALGMALRIYSGLNRLCISHNVDNPVQKGPDPSVKMLGIHAGRLHEADGPLIYFLVPAMSIPMKYADPDTDRVTRTVGRLPQVQGLDLEKGIPVCHPAQRPDRIADHLSDHGDHAPLVDRRVEELLRNGNKAAAALYIVNFFGNCFTIPSVRISANINI